MTEQRNPISGLKKSIHYEFVLVSSVLIKVMCCWFRVVRTIVSYARCCGFDYRWGHRIFFLRCLVAFLCPSRKFWDKIKSGCYCFHPQTFQLIFQSFPVIQRLKCTWQNIVKLRKNKSVTTANQWLIALIGWSAVTDIRITVTKWIDYIHACALIEGMGKWVMKEIDRDGKWVEEMTCLVIVILISW